MDCPASEYKTRRFRNALADWSHVFWFQIPRFWYYRDSTRTCRSYWTFDLGYGSRYVLVNICRYEWWDAFA
jgi:hypothetical protein